LRAIPTIDDHWHLFDRAEQAESIRIGKDGSWLERALYAARQAWGIATAPEDVKPFHAMRFANVLEIRRMAARVASVLEEPEGRDVLADRPQIRRADLAALRQLPANTLGGAFARFAIARNLDPEFFPLVDHLDPDEGYLHRRAANTHDIWHVLADVDIEHEGEVTMAVFTTGQLGGPWMHVIALMATLTLVVRPSLLPLVWRTYLGAKRARCLKAVYWERRWHQPLDEVRRELGVVVDPDRRLAIR
jgi:ubiquinone biosynthesis protein COQ4